MDARSWCWMWTRSPSTTAPWGWRPMLYSMTTLRESLCSLKRCDRSALPTSSRHYPYTLCTSALSGFKEPRFPWRRSHQCGCRLGTRFQTRSPRSGRHWALIPSRSIANQVHPSQRASHSANWPGHCTNWIRQPSSCQPITITHPWPMQMTGSCLHVVRTTATFLDPHKTKAKGPMMPNLPIKLLFVRGVTLSDFNLTCFHCRVSIPLMSAGRILTEGSCCSSAGPQHHLLTKDLRWHWTKT